MSGLPLVAGIIGWVSIVRHGGGHRMTEQELEALRPAGPFLEEAGQGLIRFSLAVQIRF